MLTDSVNLPLDFLPRDARTAFRAYLATEDFAWHQTPNLKVNRVNLEPSTRQSARLDVRNTAKGVRLVHKLPGRHCCSSRSCRPNGANRLAYESVPQWVGSCLYGLPSSRWAESPFSTRRRPCIQVFPQDCKLWFCSYLLRCSLLAPCTCLNRPIGLASHLHLRFPWCCCKYSPLSTALVLAFCRV
jgi:hypothetical protein